MQARLADARMLLRPTAAVLAALAFGAVAVAALGRDPRAVYGALAAGTFGSGYGFGQVLFKSTTLLGTGLAAAIAFRAGLFNIGLEGQLYCGGLAAAVAALALPQGTPAALAVPATLAAAALAGAGWAALPGALRARLGVHEVIATILLNFVAFALGSWILVRRLAQFETLHTAEIPIAAHLPRLEGIVPAFRGAPVNASLVVEAILCIAAGIALWRTRWGYEIRAVGLAPGAAAAAGIPVRRRLFEAMLASGGFAGIAAANFVQGYKHYFEEGFTAEAGFKGLAVALLAGSHPAALVPAALLFGALDRGGFVVNAEIPKEFVDILQALVLACVLVAMRLGRRGREA